MVSKFVNLRKEYRDFVEQMANNIKLLNIDENNLTRKKLNEMYDLYQNTYQLVGVESSGINVNDINHIMTDYGKENNDVNVIKNFIKLKNAYVIHQTMHSSLWTPFINKLYESIDIKNIKIKKQKILQLIEKGAVKLLRTSIDQFCGCWEIAEFKDNKLKKLEIIEPEHLEFITKYIMDKVSKTLEPDK